MKRFFKPNMVVGVIALVVAMTGSAAAGSLITGRQIKDGTITGADIKNRSVGAAELSNDAFSELQGDMGPQGPAGPAGAQGPAGPAGPAGPSAVARIAPITGNFSVPAGTSSSSIQILTINCPAGQRVVSGGYFTDSGIVFADKTYDGASWSVGVDNYGSSVNADGNVTALCAPAGTAVATGADHAARDAQIQRDEQHHRESARAGK